VTLQLATSFLNQINEYINFAKLRKFFSDFLLSEPRLVRIRFSGLCNHICNPVNPLIGGIMVQTVFDFTLSTTGEHTMRSKFSKIAFLAGVSLALAFTLNSCASKAQQAAAGGFETVTTPAAELEEIKRDMESKLIPCGIGMGESSDEMVARNVSGDEARTDMAKTLNNFVERLSESYAENVSNEAKKIWEEGVRQSTHQELNGATSYKSITQFNKESGHYKIYSLYVMNPELLKKAVQAATSSQEELELRVKKDDMMKKLDEGTAAYNAKYKR